MKIITIYLILIILLVIFGCQVKPDYKKVGFAPPEAFEEGSEYPYFGSVTPKGFIKTALTETNKNLYKRHGQKQIFEIISGNPDEAVRLCNLKIDEFPDDPEFLYTLSIAQSQLGEMDETVKTMESALSLGLPFERFLVGPRDLIQPLAETETFKELASEYENKLIHGPLLGCVTGSSAKFWVRTAFEKSVQIRISRSSDLSNPSESEVKSTDLNEDYTTILEITDLKPATTYYYDVSVGG